jgi:hypothetical protein
MAAMAEDGKDGVYRPNVSSWTNENRKLGYARASNVANANSDGGAWEGAGAREKVRFKRTRVSISVQTT